MIFNVLHWVLVVAALFVFGPSSVLVELKLVDFNATVTLQCCSVELGDVKIADICEFEITVLKILGVPRNS